MTSKTVDISDEDVENLPPSESLPNNINGMSIENSPTLKLNNYMKQRGRRRRWWYFNRGLQPISEVAEIKDDTFKCESNGDSPVFMDDSSFINSSSPTDNTIISSSIPQNKEGYSACLKVIEKFQEVVIDSAVRVIQAAFKRFRERRRFLRIKKAVMVIQRNLRKWLESKHPCIRPANFERQSSDGSKSDEYRESVHIENEFEGCTEETDEKENDKDTNTKSEQCQENDNAKGSGISLEKDTVVIQRPDGILNIHDNDSTQNFSDVDNVNTEVELTVKSEDLSPNPNNCFEESEKEIIESNHAQVISVSYETTCKQEEILSDVKSLLEELLVKVTSDSDLYTDQVKTEECKKTCIGSTDICSPYNLSEDNVCSIETKQCLFNKEDKESKEHKETADDSENREKHVTVVISTSPHSLKATCQKILDMSVILNSQNNMEEASS